MSLIIAPRGSECENHRKSWPENLLHVLYLNFKILIQGKMRSSCYNVLNLLLVLSSSKVPAAYVLPVKNFWFILINKVAAIADCLKKIKTLQILK